VVLAVVVVALPELQQAVQVQLAKVIMVVTAPVDIQAEAEVAPVQ
jgi:multisubunit Na+/H+ antiporter MnhG subunit